VRLIRVRLVLVNLNPINDTYILILYCLNEPVGHNLKTNTPQAETVSNAEGAWTTIRRKTTTRQTYGSDNKSFDTGKLTLVVNKYACLIKEDQIENDRKTINTCKALLRILHPQPVRKMIPVNFAMHPTSKAGKGKTHPDRVD